MAEFSRRRRAVGPSIPDPVEAPDCCERTIYRRETGESPPQNAALEYNSTQADRRLRPARGFTFIDLFAGIGGLRRGFEPIGGRCVFTSEWDKYSVQTYTANYACDHEIVGDIRPVRSTSIPKHDVLLAGFPCQPFSLAGVSKFNALGRMHGFQCETQGTLFFQVARIIKDREPRAFLIENVKNLLSHDGGRTFEVIRRTLEDDLGYQIQTRIIDAKSFVPQHRERIFIVGFRERNSFRLEDLKIPDPLNGPKLRTVLHPEDGSESPDDQFTFGAKGNVLAKYTLSDKLWTYLQNYAEKHRAKGNGFGFGLVGRNDVARTLSARYFKDGSEILVRQRGNRNPRRLTPRECARLMGFENAGCTAFRIPVSDTQAYRQFGNAVVVPVVEAVARHMEPWINADADVDQRGRALALA
jgi:DNA (cytosine-5)-methyltransferase 1